MIILTQLFVCDICGRAVKRRRQYLPGYEVEKPSLPYGWEQVLDQQVCIKHVVKIRITDYKPPTSVIA